MFLHLQHVIAQCLFSLVQGSSNRIFNTNTQKNHFANTSSTILADHVVIFSGYRHTLDSRKLQKEKSLIAFYFKNNQAGADVNLGVFEHRDNYSYTGLQKYFQRNKAASAKRLDIRPIFFIENRGLLGTRYYPLTEEKDFMVSEGEDRKRYAGFVEVSKGLNFSYAGNENIEKKNLDERKKVIERELIENFSGVKNKKTYGLRRLKYNEQIEFFRVFSQNISDFSTLNSSLDQICRTFEHRVPEDQIENFEKIIEMLETEILLQEYFEEDYLKMINFKEDLKKSISGAEISEAKVLEYLLRRHPERKSETDEFFQKMLSERIGEDYIDYGGLEGTLTKQTVYYMRDLLKYYCILIKEWKTINNKKIDKHNQYVRAMRRLVSERYIERQQGTLWTNTYGLCLEKMKIGEEEVNNELLEVFDQVYRLWTQEKLAEEKYREKDYYFTEFFLILYISAAFFLLKLTNFI